MGLYLPQHCRNKIVSKCRIDTLRFVAWFSSLYDSFEVVFVSDLFRVDLSLSNKARTLTILKGSTLAALKQSDMNSRESPPL